MPNPPEEWDKRDSITPISHHILAGSIAGLSEHITMLPFDNIKTRLQVLPDQTLIQVAKDINKRGMRAFFSGITSSSLGCMPAHALQFTIYELDNEEHHPIQFALIGVLATFFHDMCMTPFDVIKQRTQILNGQTSRSIFKNMIKKEGIISLYRSFPITFLSNGPNQALIFSANESFKRFIAHKDDLSTWAHTLSGGLAGGFAAVLTVPLDVIKTKLQTQTCHLSEEKQLKELIRYANISSTARIIMKELGWRGFFVGLLPRFYMQTPSSAIAWGSYEFVKKSLLQVQGVN